MPKQEWRNYQKEWPELTMSRPAGLAFGLPGQVARRPDSYAAICKKPQVSRINSLARIRGQSQGLFPGEQALPQAVSKQHETHVLLLKEQTASS